MRDWGGEIKVASSCGGGYFLITIGKVFWMIYGSEHFSENLSCENGCSRCAFNDFKSVG